MKNKDFFKEYIVAFLKQNSMLNLISKNDEKYLWEKHIYDSLAIENFFNKYGTGFKTMLDIGSGGGFPAVPVALAYPDLEVCALDSIRKKINAIENLKSELDIKNLQTVCERAENLKQKFDLITSRAVAPLKVIAGYAAPLLNDGGCFVAYKSKRADEEISEAGETLKKVNLKIVDIIEYELPLDENYTRNLIVLKKFSKK
ncbi:TPA: 16S rRNA (guanine(527)-N(7))-methyltransferase RsmG [Candidatus Scatousia excrementigallinarum]|uniref:Ribosomal RNA small subunit methyltransferase G n=1 Tax=Candidatus Scatousia excrementigallinarum TaxID=2840935 RepID=A0A9D1F112_9BACT|nr:16S rRNA (guanine(527)-N(7))-methyltransferase RsmG [Candidatus Scatousia excrementigallinarum]